MPDYAKRAELLLTIIIKSGGEATTRDVWLEVNKTEKLTYSLISNMLHRMNGMGHVEMTGTPALWRDTRKGRDWLERRKK